MTDILQFPGGKAQPAQPRACKPEDLLTAMTALVKERGCTELSFMMTDEQGVSFLMSTLPDTAHLMFKLEEAKANLLQGGIHAFTVTGPE